jgi:hypothetical protein
VRHIPLIAAVLAAAVLAPIAASADRMWVGFHDDPILRYDADRQGAMTTATATNNASIVRSLVTWADVAPTKPSNAADPFDPAYRFDDLDEFVRNAQKNNAEVLLTLWGTPKWANGDKGRNYLPTSMTDFQNFAKAIATRYSGRTAGFPFVRFYGPPTPSSLQPDMRGSRQGTPRHSSRSARRRRAAGTRRRPARATPSRRARSPRWSRRRTRSSSSMPGPSIPIRFPSIRHRRRR